MDKAFIGSCTIGYGRIGVQDPAFDIALKPFQDQPAQQGIVGGCTIGEGHRIGVQIPRFDRSMEPFEKRSARHGGGITPCIQGEAKQGSTRQKIKIPVFHEMMERMKNG